MEDFDIPESHVKALVGYLNFPLIKKEIFLKNLESADIGISLSELITHLQQSLEEDEIISDLAISILNMLITSENFVEKDFISVILRSINVDPKKNFEGNSAYSEIEKLLNINKHLILSVKGEYLASNGERVLSDVKIITDIRPVFMDNGLEEIKASVLLYTLRLKYSQNNESIIEYVSLDESDLKKLKLQIDRAQKKRESIEATMKKANVKLIRF